jgi:hypothetical protein
MNAILPVIGLAVFLTVLLVWARRAWRKYEEENIYEPDPRSEAHKRDPFMQERIGDVMHRGGGPKAF